MDSKVLFLTSLLGSVLGSSCSLVKQVGDDAQGPPSIDCADTSSPSCPSRLPRLGFQGVKQKLSPLGGNTVWQRAAISTWSDGKQLHGGLFVKDENSNLLRFLFSKDPRGGITFGEGAPFKLRAKMEDVTAEVLDFGPGTYSPVTPTQPAIQVPNLSLLIKSPDAAYWVLFVPLTDFSASARSLSDYYRVRFSAQITDRLAASGLVIPEQSKLLLGVILNQQPTLFDYSSLKDKESLIAKELQSAPSKVLNTLPNGAREVPLKLIDLNADGADEWILHDEEAGEVTVSSESMTATLQVDKGSQLLGFADVDGDKIKDAVFLGQDRMRIQVLTLAMDQARFSGAVLRAELSAPRYAALAELMPAGAGAATQLVTISADAATIELMTLRVQDAKLQLERAAEVVLSGSGGSPGMAAVKPTILVADLDEDRLPDLLIGRGSEVLIFRQQAPVPGAGLP